MTMITLNDLQTFLNQDQIWRIMLAFGLQIIGIILAVVGLTVHWKRVETKKLIAGFGIVFLAIGDVVAILILVQLILM